MNQSTAPTFRRMRLARGWEPVQMVGRMKILADRNGVNLPQVWLLLRLVFLWENHREPVPAEYAGLLAEVFNTSTTTGRRQ
ncbi:hypothetical protein OHA72_21950 [Dactylosporangium sp. NBC_01737]|uniref:hypothetical protein n=1 Tax=Dactylosporangium sp. NBC_01737 TaxID=2975959 RepID=UPI002E0D2699|nr:hypothetical protein OHA72_21950 [Dactylosporangium sp. NBC_01737]